MKNYKIILIIFSAILLNACKKDSVEIDTLQVLGDEFYQGQAVNVGMAVKTSNSDKNYYEWSCEEGSFIESMQGYPTNQWTAPRKNGVYTIRCKVTCGNASQTREAKIKVSGTFFDRFTGTAHGWTATNQTTTLNNGRMETLVTATRPDTDTAGNVVKSLGISNFYPPVSATADLGIVSGPGNTYTPYFYPGLNGLYPSGTTWKTGWDNYMGVGLTGKNPANTVTETYYISEIMVYWYPAAHYKTQVTYFDPSDDQTPRIKNSADFDGRIAVKWIRKANAIAGEQERTGTFSVFFSAPGLKMNGVEENKNVGISIDENYVIRLNLNKSTDVFFTTDALKTWRTSHDNAMLEINQYKYYYPRYTRVYLDNLVVNNQPDFLY